MRSTVYQGTLFFQVYTKGLAYKILMGFTPKCYKVVFTQASKP